MLSSKLEQYAASCWCKAQSGLGEFGLKLASQLEHFDREERILLELALGTLPASDVASVGLPILASYAQHALFLRKHVPYCRTVPEDIFLNFVFYPRINTERIVDCRRFFYDLVSPVTQGLPAAEAALSVNRWCAAQMTYEPTDDRTIDPLSAYFCGLGRCGEESTFCVTVLRAVGIPARQIYVPLWSHCDDNHAWVEVYVDGKWHFFGACEPEPVLDRGWFQAAAARAMLVVSRSFLDDTTDMPSEQLVCRSGICRMLNQTARYAKTVRLTLTVASASSAPIADAWVRVYVPNLGSFGLISALQTDCLGMVHLQIGAGSCLLEAEAGHCFAWQVLQLHGDTVCTLTPNLQAPQPGIREWDFPAPPAAAAPIAPLTADQAQERTKLLLDAQQQRLARQNARAADPFEDERLAQCFRQAGRHAPRLLRLCRTYGTLAKALLLSLTPKDWRDADPEVLSAHLEAASALPGADRAEFVPYVLCPRIGLEPLSAWRGPILRALSPSQANRFAQNPPALWAWIQQNFREGDCRWYPELWLQPDAAFAIHAADENGRRLLFVAILRTLGVPARLYPEDGRAQYFDGASFCGVEDSSPTAQLSLSLPQPLVPGRNWTLSRWYGGRWHTLTLSHSEPYSLPLHQGLYRLISALRLPSGDQLIRQEIFPLEFPTQKSVLQRCASMEQMLTRIPVDLPSEAVTLWLYLEPGSEPSEHVFNEVSESGHQLQDMAQQGLAVKMVLPKCGDPIPSALHHIASTLPGVSVLRFHPDDPALEGLARSLYLEPGTWPLIVLSDGTHARYSHAGYAAGLIPLVLDLARMILSESSEPSIRESHPRKKQTGPRS